MIIGKVVDNDDEKNECYNLLREVFCDELCLEENEVFEEVNQSIIQVIVKQSNQCVGTGRLVWKKEYYKIGRIAIDPNERGKQYGEFVVRLLLKEAFQLGAEKVLVHSQLHAIGFYEKLGFRKEGNEVVELGVLHQPMIFLKDNWQMKCH